MKDRCAVISEYNSAYEDIKKKQKELVRRCSDQFRLKSDDAEIVELEDFLNQWMTRFEEQNPIIQDYIDDAVLERILSIFDGKVGEGFSTEDISSIEQEGKRRYANQTPPGYKDADKKKSGNNNVYGDLIIWKEILRFASNDEKDIIFITDDKKEDWWNIINGKRIGPRVELRREFYNETKNRRFHMYTMDRFFSMLSDNKEEPIDKAIIEEIDSVSKETEQTDEDSFNREYDSLSGVRIRQLEDRLINLFEKNEKRRNAKKHLQDQIRRGAGNPEEILFEIRHIDENILKTEKEIERIRRELEELRIKAKKEKRRILLETELENITGR